MYFHVFTRDNLERYTSDYTVQVLVGYCTVYIFMQTFMIPGTVFMSLLAGSLFGVLRGVALVVFAATAGASSCYFLSNLIGRPLISSMWPDKLVFFQGQVRLKCSIIEGFQNQNLATFIMGQNGQLLLRVKMCQSELTKNYFLFYICLNKVNV